MADSINLDIGYFDHIKTVRLASKLGRGAEMLPIRLWCYCGMHPKDNGTLTDFSADDVEAVILKWWGKRGQAVEAMVTVGFLEFDGSRYIASGWNAKNGHIIAFHERAVNAANARWGKLKGEECLSIATSNATSIAKQCPTDRPTVLPTKSKHKPPNPPTSFEIPEDLRPNTLEIVDWIAYKAERREVYKTKGLEALWRTLRRIPPDRRRVSIDRSMASGWRGIFDDSKGGQNGSRRIVGEACPVPGKYANISN